MSTKLNNPKYCYVSLTIQLIISHLFTLTYIIKQFYFKQFSLAYVHSFCFHTVKYKSSWFQTIYFKVITQFSSIWSSDRTRSGATTTNQSWLGSQGNEGAPRIPQSYNITKASLLYCFVSYPGHLLGESYLSAEMQSVYSAAIAD